RRAMLRRAMKKPGGPGHPAAVEPACLLADPRRCRAGAMADCQRGPWLAPTHPPRVPDGWAALGFLERGPGRLRLVRHGERWRTAGLPHCARFAPEVPAGFAPGTAYPASACPGATHKTG